MRQKNVSKLHEREFWKGLVSSSDPDPPLDENGEPIEVPEKTLSSFAIIKKMMRLKEKQDQMPESEKKLTFTPTVQPEFTENGKDIYYFDIQNNKEHY